MPRHQIMMVLVLGVAQSIVWASTYYLPAVLGQMIARDCSVSPVVFFAIVTGALIISAMMGPRVGAAVDNLGGRTVLSVSTIPTAIGLAILAIASDFYTLAAAWLLLGIGMGLGLYEAAAATLASMCGVNARQAIGYYTLMAAGSSSLGWLLTSWGTGIFGWRATCLVWAAVHIVVVAPLYLMLPSKPRVAPELKSTEVPSAVDRSGQVRQLALCFCASGIVITGVAAHLPRLLEVFGVSPSDAINAAALLGPAVILMRLLDVTIFRNTYPIRLASVASLLHPIGALALFAGMPTMIFPVLHGIAAGTLATARATVPLALFGTEGFGRRYGRLSRMIRLVSATGPLLFSVIIERFGPLALALSAALCVVASIAFLIAELQNNRGR